MEVSASEEPQHGIWASIKEAISGSHQDYTEGNLDRAVILLAIPMVLEMVMESLLAVVDAFFVSGLGTDAVAAVALTESLLVILYAIAIGLSMSTTAMVARRIGEKDREGAAIAAAQSILLGTLLSVAVAVIGVAFAPQLLRLMGGDEAVIRQGQTFTRTILGANITIFLLFLNNAIFRGAGDAAIAMRALWIANGVNIVLNPCLIRGLGPFPELGLLGSAVATTIGRGTGVVFQLWVLMSGSGRLSVGLKQFQLHLDVMLRLLRVSLMGILQFLISTSSWMGLVRIIATFGSSALAGYLFAIRVIVFAILPSWGLCNAAATLVGQNLGAGKPDRAEKSVWRAGLYNMAFLGLVSVIFIIFAEPIILIFTNEPAVIRHGVNCLRYVSYGYVFYAWGMVTVQAFNGAGDTLTPTWINLACLWMFQIPMAWVLAKPMGLGPTGVFLGMTIAESVLAVVGIFAFRAGRWKKQQI
ncbi:MAG: MATE family efflux transporter [Bryobacterales bacterium]|nr:MATE family efflux transporter [Bryobacterales bacterium]